MHERGSNRYKHQELEWLQTSAKKLGFEYFSLVILQKDISSHRLILSENNFLTQRNRTDNYRLNGLEHPAINHCLRTVLPVIWSQALFESDAEFWSILCRCGMQHGVSQSIHSQLGLTSVFSFIQKDSAIEPEQLYERMGPILWLANRIHGQLAEPLSRATSTLSCPLSARELEVLRLAAQGKTSASVAAALQLADRTVNFHMQSILAKLKVPNRTVALIIASQNGWL